MSIDPINTKGLADDCRWIITLLEGTAEDVRRGIEAGRSPHSIDLMEDMDHADPLSVVYYSDNPNKVEIMEVLFEHKADVETFIYYDTKLPDGAHKTPVAREARKLIQAKIQEWLDDLAPRQRREWEEELKKERRIVQAKRKARREGRFYYGGH